MPYKRRYKRRPRRRRKRRKTSKTVKKIRKIATQVARKVLHKNTDAQWVQNVVGSYAAVNGQWSNFGLVRPGPSVGVYREFPHITIPAADMEKAGLPSFRSDNQIQVSAIKIRYRFALPDGVSEAKLWLFLALVKDGDLLITDFPTPDRITMIANDNALEADQWKVKILKVKQLKFTNGYDSKDVSLYHKFRKPYVIKYTGDAPDAFLNRRFAVCVKASYQINTAAPQYITMCGTTTTYYRDL